MGSSFCERSDLVYDITSDTWALAESSYYTARESLDTLKDIVSELPLTLVDVTIGDNINASWTDPIGILNTSEKPDLTFVTDLIAGLPVAPTVPTVDVEIAELADPSDESGTLSAPGSTGASTPPDVTALGIMPDIEATVPTAPEAATVRDISATAPTVGGVGSVGAVDVTAPTIASLGAVPTISAVAPTIDPSVLVTSFDWTEPTYAGEISAELEAELLSIISGNGVLAQSYWDSRLASLQADISLEQTAQLRRASNAGAASWMPLPSEARLAATSSVEDGISKMLQKARLEMALEQTRQYREDFWEAVKTGLAYEQMWVNFHDHVAQRSLAAAEQLARIAIDVFNVNTRHYNLLVESAKIALAIDQANIDRVLATQRVELEGSAQEIASVRVELDAEKSQADIDLQTERLGLEHTGKEIDAAKLTLEAENISVQRDLAAARLGLELFGQELSAAELETKIDQAKLARGLQSYEMYLKEVSQKLEGIKTQIADHQAEWTAKIGAFNSNTERANYSVRRFGELVKKWGTGVDADIKADQLQLDRSKIEADVFKTQYGALDAAASAADSLTKLWATGQDLSLRYDLGQLDWEYKDRLIQVEAAKLNQAAQEVSAKIDVAQAQWAEGQANALSTRISELSFGFSQAAMSATHVNMSATSNMAVSQSASASQNTDLVWDFNWGFCGDA